MTSTESLKVTTPSGGRTTLTSTTVFPTPEVMDTLLRSGLARSAGETYEKLAEHLATID